MASRSWSRFSAGIHPWHLEQVDRSSQLRKLKTLLDDPMVVAVGEAGLDRGWIFPLISRPLFSGTGVFGGKGRETHDCSLCAHLFRPAGDSEPTYCPGSADHTRFSRYQGNGREITRQGAYLSFGHSLLHPASRQALFFADLPPERVFSKRICRLWVSATCTNGHRP